MITWIKRPGRVAELTAQVGNTGIYATSDDGRFRIYAHRYIVGDKGRRIYQYRFSCYDTLQKKDLLFKVGENLNTTTNKPEKAKARCQQEQEK